MYFCNFINNCLFLFTTAKEYYMYKDNKETKQQEIESAINSIQIIGDALDDKMSYYRTTQNRFNKLINSYYPNNAPDSLKNTAFVKLRNIERDIRRIERQLINARNKREMLSREYFIKYTNPNNKHVKFICTNFVTGSLKYKCRHAFPADMYNGPKKETYSSSNSVKQISFNKPNKMNYVKRLYDYTNEKVPTRVIGGDNLYNTAPDDFVDFLMSADSIVF